VSASKIDSVLALASHDCSNLLRGHLNGLAHVEGVARFIHLVWALHAHLVHKRVHFDTLIAALRVGLLIELLLLLLLHLQVRMPLHHHLVRVLHHVVVVLHRLLMHLMRLLLHHGLAHDMRSHLILCMPCGRLHHRS